MKKFLSFLLILAMTVTMAACGGAPTEEASGDNGGSDSDTIRIGVICPRTGECSIYGDVLYQTVQLLAEKQNEAGGLLGKQIEIPGQRGSPVLK